MRKASVTIIACLLVAMVIVPPAIAQGEPQQEPSARDPAFEQEICDRLAAINPDAVPIFQEATRAMDAGALTTAKRGYEEVLALAPDFPDAARRLSYVEVELGNIDAALERARQAYDVEDSPYNHMALARALLASEDPDKAQEAMTHAWKATIALPDDADVNLVLLSAGLANEDLMATRQASKKLVRVLPEFPLGHFFAGIVAAEDGKLEQAEQELLLARELGMPEESVQAALDGGIAEKAREARSRRDGGWAPSWSHVAEAWYVRFEHAFDSVVSLLPWAAFAFGGELAGLAGLSLVGILLSRLTLAATQRTARSQSGERVLRALYRVVIAITSLGFYAFILLLLLLLLWAIVLLVLFVSMAALWWAANYGLFGAFLTLGGILMSSFLALALFRALYRVAHTVIVHIEEPEPGRRLQRDEAPQLWSLVEQIAERVGTRAVDEIYVTPVPRIGVTERGSLIEKVRGTGRRCLILGLGTLPGMSQGQFKAILAHEYGHFSSRDTAGGDLALRVRLSIGQMALRLAARGQAVRRNPVWLFVSGFHVVFLHITLGASRLQEVSADRYAAITYGVGSFVDGLTHIVRQGSIFDTRVSREVELARRSGRQGLPNLYAHVSLESDRLRETSEWEIARVMSRRTLPSDSHPAMRERIKLVRQLEVADQGEESQEPVWDLLPDAEALQEEMTAAMAASVL